jgi:hypothetical protein
MLDLVHSSPLIKITVTRSQFPVECGRFDVDFDTTDIPSAGRPSTQFLDTITLLKFQHNDTGT